MNYAEGNRGPRLDWTLAARIFERIFDILGQGAARLDGEQAYYRFEAVLDAVAHLPRQQRLMLKRLLKSDVSLLTSDRDFRAGREPGNKIGIALIELTGVATLDFKNAEIRPAFTRPKTYSSRQSGED